MPRILKNIRIDEVSACTKGAGVGTRIVLMKRADSDGRDDVYNTDWYRQQTAIAERQNEEHLREDAEREEHDERVRKAARKRFQENWNKAFAADDRDGDSVVDGGNNHHVSQVANMLVEAGSHSTREDALAYLLHHKDGAALLRRLKKEHQEFITMLPEQMEAARAEKLKSLNAVAIAKVLAEDNDAHGITEPELVELISNHDRQPGESEAQCFTRHYTAPTPDGLAIRKAVEVAKTAGAAPYFDLQPLVVDGADALDVDDPAKAIAQLTAIGRQKWPTASEAEAFERAFTDPANAKLAAKAHRRPAATTVYPFPR